jgi:thiosulfate/3-mercaptopyruvate sulfurtransferase
MLPSRFLSRHVAGAALSCAVLAAPRVTPAQMYAPPSAPVVVSTDWLAQHLNDPNLVLLHVGNRKEYDAGHIPGARYVTLDDISVSSHDHDNGLMLEMPKPDSLRAQLEALGISSDSRVIVYYGNDWVSPATRVIFTLDYAGLGAGSALLDGGMGAWKAEGRALSTVAPKQSRGQLAALHVKPIVVDAAWVKGRLGTPNFHLIDGRAAVFYDGVEMGGSRKGHVAGAKSLPYTEIADDNLKLRSAAELRALFARAGVTPGDTVVAYCHIGQQATAVLFAARSLGHPVLLYDGSYQDWSRRADLPVEDPRAGKASAQ